MWANSPGPGWGWRCGYQPDAFQQVKGCWGAPGCPGRRRQLGQGGWLGTFWWFQAHPVHRGSAAGMRHGKGELFCSLSPPWPLLSWGLHRAVDPGRCHPLSLRAPRLGPWHRKEAKQSTQRKGEHSGQEVGSPGKGEQQTRSTRVRSGTQP